MLKLKTKGILPGYILLIIFSGIFLFTSCEQNNSNPVLNGNGTASAKFGDSTISYSFTVGGGIPGSYSGPLLTFTSINSSINLYFELISNAGFVGIYNLSNKSPNTVSISVLKNNTTYTTDSTHTGIITINSYNPQLQTISGAFHFTAVAEAGGHPNEYDTIVVSNGNFIANLQINYIVTP